MTALYNPKIIQPKSVNNKWYHFIGLLFIMLNYIRHQSRGYKTPRTFSVNQIGLVIDYDFKVVERWAEYLFSYTNEKNFFKNKVVLELGPGADLGTGLILLAMGVKRYIAFDVNELAKSAPVELYSRLFDRLKDKYPNYDADYFKLQLNKCYKGKDSVINYIVDKNFEVSKIKDKIDIVFSQAAFEHFADVEKTLKQLSNVVEAGGILVTEIDLKTHTRWIKDKDPLNIYRYNESFWKFFSFKGSPNRVRAFEYKELLEKNGWFDIEIAPITILEEEYLEKVRPLLNKQFREMNSSEMKMLSIMLMTKKGNFTGIF